MVNGPYYLILNKSQINPASLHVPYFEMLDPNTDYFKWPISTEQVDIFIVIQFQKSMVDTLV